MYGILAPGFDQPLVFIPPPAKGKGKKKQRLPDLDTGLDGSGADFDGEIHTQHTQYWTPVQSQAHDATCSF